MKSVCSLLGLANFGAYNAAKGGAVSLTQTAAAEGASQNIRVNSIVPSATKTELLKDMPPNMLERFSVAMGGR
jgi:NAD(P)-dependent dehydrogenase (short-subunit alcohol dehydrogenase family)